MPQLHGYDKTDYKILDLNVGQIYYGWNDV